MSPWQAASAILALNSGRWIRLLRLVAAVPSVILMLMAALIPAQTLPNHRPQHCARTIKFLY